MSDIYRRSLMFIIWQNYYDYERSRNIGMWFLIWITFFNNFLLHLGLGAVELYFGQFKFDQIYSGWYPLFPLFSLGLDPNYSPWLQKNHVYKTVTFIAIFLLRCLAQIFSKFNVDMNLDFNVKNIHIDV